MSNSGLKLEGKAWSSFQDVELAPQTKKLYSWWIENFMGFCKVKNPDKLLEFGTSKKAVHQIEDKVIAWLGVLKDSGKASATMRTALACVVLFYSCNRVKLDNKFISRRIPKKPGRLHRSPTKEEVAAIVEAANLRGKALLGLLASTGVRLGAIPPLKMRHRRNVKPEELEHHDCSCKDRSQPLRFNGYLLNVYEGEEEQYFTFISQEAGKWLDTYFRMRENAGEDLKPNSPLIREEFDIAKPDVVEKPFSCKEIGLQSFMTRLQITAGVKAIVKKGEQHQGSIRKEWKNVHGFRAFFSTAATNAGVNFSFKELMLGHHLNLEKSYYDSNNPRSVHAALAEYLKMQDAVTLFSSSRLERDNLALREQVTEIQDLREYKIESSSLIATMARQLKEQAKQIEELQNRKAA